MRRPAHVKSRELVMEVDSFSHTFEDAQHPENCEKE
jgi:hypothetical protein